MTKSKHEGTLDAIKSAIKALENLDAEQQKQAIKTITQLLGHASAANDDPDSAATVGGGTAGFTDLSKLSPKAFMKAKKPMLDVEKVTCLAYYLTHARDTQHFKTGDMTKLNTEAAQPVLSNTTVAIDNATRQSQYLTSATGGKKQITPLGEAVVEALPNQEAVKVVIAEHGKRKRRKKAKKK